MTVSDDYGAIVLAGDVRTAVTATLRLWLPAYLAEIGRQKNTAPLPGIASWVDAVNPQTFPEDALPAAVVVCPGIVANPSRRAGAYDAGWQVAVAVVAQSTTRRDVLDNVATYSAAVRAIMAQQSSCGGFAEAWEWSDENADMLPTEGSRTIAYGQVGGILYVKNVVAVNRGPMTPPDDPTIPPSPWPTIEDTAVAVTPT